MATVSFLQISDLHLGAPLAWLARDQRAERRREQQRALERAVQLAVERAVHAILIPGDLFDDVEMDAENLAFAIHAFRISGCPPVFIAPGNHDPYSESSPTWSARMLAARDLRWPPHVHVFASPRWSSIRLDPLPVRIWGRCFTPGMASAERPLGPEARDQIGAPPLAELNVGLFHGSLEGHCPPGQKLVGPFSIEEAEQAPFAWMAVGHYHRTLSHPRFAYAGSAVALDTTETGVHGALEVRVELGAAPAAAHFELIELDARRAHTLDIDVTEAGSADQIDRRILDAFERASVATRDLVKVRLCGRLTRGLRWSAPADEIAARAWHVRVDTAGLRPDYDLEALRRGSDETTEGRVARVLLEQLDRETDPEARATIERAVYYGLDAFRLREVTPMWEEIGG